MNDFTIPKYLEEAEKKLYDSLYNAIDNNDFDVVERVVVILKKLSLI